MIGAIGAVTNPITTPDVNWLAIAPELALGGRGHPHRADKGASPPPVRGHTGRVRDRRGRRHRRGGHPLLAVAGDPRQRPDGHPQRDGAGRRVGRVPRGGDRERDRARVAPRGRLPAAGGAREARVPRAGAVLRARHGGDDQRQQLDRRVPRARGAVDPVVRAVRLRPQAHELARGRHQVLRARGVLIRDLPVRDRARSTGRPAALRSRASSTS